MFARYMSDRVLLGWIICLLAIGIVMYRPRMVYARTSGGNAVYVNNTPQKTQSAEYLESMRAKVRVLLTEGLRDNPKDPILRRIEQRWTGDLSEVEVGSKNIAYSVSKADIRVCVKDASGKFGDPDAAMYVLIHELAHVATDEYGHTDTFWKNMRYLLELSEKYGIYTHAQHTGLCDRPLGESPLTCVKNGKCKSELQNNLGGT